MSSVHGVRTHSTSSSAVYCIRIMDVNEDLQRLLVEANVIEDELKRDARNISNIIKMVELLLRMAKPEKALTFLGQGFSIFMADHRNLSSSVGLQLVDVSIRYWKHIRYETKTKLNTTVERYNTLSDIWNVLMLLSKDVKARLSSIREGGDGGADANDSQIISVRMAYVKESLGSNTDALSILSDLIAAHAVEAVDLSYIIFKAAIVLKNIGQNKQSIEYLEFLLDDPPLQEGYSKLHILAFLILLYEQSGDKYKVFLHKTYKDLKTAYGEDLANKKVSTANNLRKLNDIIKSPALSTSSEVWEILATQALERCEYVMALELLQQAVAKAPTKGKLHLIIAEVHGLLQKPEQSLASAEKAIALIPSNVECRDLLLKLNPDKYTEKLRSATVVNVAVKNRETASAVDEFDEGPGESPAEGAATGGHEAGGWMDKVKSKASGTLKSMTDNGVAATLLTPIIQGAASAASTAKAASSVAAPSPASSPSKKKPTGAKKTAVHRGKDLQPRPVVARPVPQEPEQEQEEQGNPFRPKRPQVDAEAQRRLRLILSGNQSTHFYDTSMRELADIRAQSSSKKEPSDA